MDASEATSMLQSMHISVLTTPHDTLPDFVHAPDDKYTCAQCRRTLRPPVKQTICGHRLCANDCVVLLFRDNDAPLCPANEDCEILRQDELNPDIAATKELLRMLVYCPFRSNGCQVTIKWAGLKGHADDCQYASVTCHNPGCDASMLRQDLKHHEQNECDYTPILCQLCDNYIPRIELQNGHSNVCMPKARKCEYGVLGCDFEGMPDELKRHNRENADEHSQQQVQAIVKTSQDQIDLKQEINNLVSTVNDLKTSFDSNQSTSQGHPNLPTIAKSVANVTQDVINIKQNLSEFASQQALNQCVSKIEEIQSVSKMHESRISYLEQKSTSGSGATSDQMAEKQRQMENILSTYDIRFAEFDIRFRLLETAGYDGRLIWKITNYSRRKADAVEGRTLSLYSQPFYTSSYGYKMCARVYLNGDGMGRGTHMSMFFVVMKGEYDPLLSWPFRQKVTLSLLDQTGSRKHIKDTFRPDPTSTSFRRPVGDMNIASGSPMFARQNVVESDTYLRDDTLFISVTVEKTDLLDVP